MVSFGSLFCFIKSHLGLILVIETSRSPLGLVGLFWVSLWSLIGLIEETKGVSFGLVLVSFGSHK